MGKNLKTVLIIFGIVTLLIVTGVGVNWWKERQLVEAVTKRVAAETRLVEYKKELEVLKLENDTLKTDKLKLQTIVEYQSKNPSIIIQKYEKEHNNIDNLSNSKSFELFSNNLYEYRTNKERYSLQRFK